MEREKKMEQLMKELEFPEDAIGEILKAEEMIQKAGMGTELDQMAEQLIKTGATEEKIRKDLPCFGDMEAAAGVNQYTVELLYLLRCSLLARKAYQQRGIPAEAFRANMMDLKWKLMECRKVYGVNGIFVGWWYDRFFAMTRFALGRLQFELEPFHGEEYRNGSLVIKKGDPVINMHIPSSGPLNLNEVEESLKMAAEFFRDVFPEGPVVFVMESWLLDSDLTERLPEGNIRTFIRRFVHLKNEKQEIFQDGWRVFGASWREEPVRLPRETKLQRVIADYLMEGGKLGEGYGVLVWERPDE